MNAPDCRFCGQPLKHVFADLGVSPLANSYVAPERALEAEPFFPLTTYVCEACFLVQLPEVESPEEIFGDYAYFSSYSDSWLQHVQRYTEEMIARFGLGPADVSRLLDAQSVDLPAGQLETPEQDVLLRFVERRRTPSELEDLVVQVDEQLSRTPDSAALWSQRVDLLVDLERLYESGLRREYHRMASL